MKDKFAGSLVGQCLGDAFGFVVEGQPPDVCREYVEENLIKNRRLRAPRGQHAVGQYTDDSQLARELLQSFVALRRFEPADFAKRITVIFGENRIVARGIATDIAARRLSRGAAWEESGVRPPQAGNGSAMRAGPIGLIFFHEPQALIQAAYYQGWITHQDPRCVAGCVAIAGMVAQCLREDSMVTTRFLAPVAEWTRSFDPILSDALGRMPEWLAMDPERAVAIISKIGLDTDYSDGWCNISPFVTSSVLWSIYCFLRTPNDYLESLRTSIAVGGDVDTTAAMTGAISGAWLGLKALPQDLATLVHDAGTWKYTDLVKLAHKAFEVQASVLETAGS